jgi:hypothetical protein
MVHGQSPLVIGHVRAQGWPEASFNQGDRWKKLINPYITAMPLIGKRLEPAAQNGSGGASFAAIQAMSANVGEAARTSQPAAPRDCQALAFARFADDDVVIFRFPIDCRRFRPLQDRVGM